MERLLHTTTSLCPACHDSVEATVVARNGAAIMRKSCAVHGAHEVQISADVQWYEQTRAVAPKLSAPPNRKAISRGCPYDCGPCSLHEQKIELPVVTITSACNLNCPICYVHNKNRDAFNMPYDEFSRTVDHLVDGSGGDLDIINLTGGEPTLHPDLLRFIALCGDRGIHRVTVCTNGLRFLSDPEFVAAFKGLGARVALSFDSFDPHVDYEMQGARLLEKKLRCLELFNQHDIDTTLIPVMAKGLNDHEIGRILEFGLSMRNVRHVEVHTMTFTGQGGRDFDRARRMSMDEVLDQIQSHDGLTLERRDFVSSPCAHPLCYQVAYLLVDPKGGPPIPFTRFMSRETLYECLSERLYLEPSPTLELAIRESIDRLWVSDDAESDRLLRVLKSMLQRIFPARAVSAAESLRAAEETSKAIYIHSHMDEETFDTERIVQCCDSNCYADGSSIPVCAYNVLYRPKEPRFVETPQVWDPRFSGRRTFRSRLPVVE